ncbi:chromate transporter [Methyloglobulus morosus]
MHRSLGGITAGLLFILPSLFLLIFLSWIYLCFGDVPLVSAVLYGIKPAVTAIVWLSATQMIDDLALGETTPGPLIMAATFAGFLAGWNTVPLGGDSVGLSATLAAVIVTYFTFLPSFVFILAGGAIG